MRPLHLAALLIALPATGLLGEEPPAGVDLTREIAELADGKRSPDSFSVHVAWVRERQMTFAEIHGSGVGIWNRRVQLRVPPGEVLALAGALRTAGLGAMPGTLGEAEPEEVVKLRGKVSIRIGDRRKTVVQLEDGPRSAELEAFATDVLRTTEARAKGGVTAAEIGDALAKLAAGTLAPETFELLVQRRPETSNPADVRQEGYFLLRVNGREAVARSFRQDGGYGISRRLWLSAAELAGLIATLKEGAPGSLPRNLWAPQYTDLRLSILDQTADLSARRWLGVTADTHGAKQRAFERIFSAARTLAERVLRSGTAVPGAS